jgi:hypothetical protein
MDELSADARQTLQAFYEMHTRGGGERQTHTERAIEDRAGLDAGRVSAALQELESNGYIAPSMPPWEGQANLTSFRLKDKGRQAVDPSAPLG